MVLLLVAKTDGSSYHNSTVLTPRIDALAREGVILESYYVQPVCSPTRSSLMTGRYTYRLGTQATVIRADVPFGVPLEETFMAQNLKDAGYTTAIFGKWHLGFYKRAYTPLERGFDYHLGYFQGAIDYYTHTGGGYGGTQSGVDWHRGNETTCFADSGNYSAELIVPEAIKFLRNRATNPTEPFFLWLPFHLIHGPNQVPDKYLNLYPELKPDTSARSQGMCGVCSCDIPPGAPKFPVGWGPLSQDGESIKDSQDLPWGQCRTVLGMAAALDWAVGSVVDALVENGQYNSTVIIYTSDNGAQGGQGGTSWPLRGWKTQLYEGGIRVPGFVSGGSPLLPQSVRGTINTKLYHITDWLPTIVGLAQGQTKKNRPLDGYNIWSSIVDPSVPSPRGEILHNINPACGYGYVNPDAGIRVGPWKLLVGCFNTSTLQPNPDTKIELYNIRDDPYELSEVSNMYPEVVKNLTEKLALYGASKDQVPPTIFWPFNQSGHMIAPWNYQCPQCPHGGALPSLEGFHFDPWCENVTCGVGPPAPSPTQPTPAPAPQPNARCPQPWHMYNGGMGSSRNKDIHVERVAGWEDCCVMCIGHADCVGWTYFEDSTLTCHLHANQLDQHPGLAERITGLKN